jgi:hypothetical protein
VSAGKNNKERIQTAENDSEISYDDRMYSQILMKNPNPEITSVSSKNMNRIFQPYSPNHSNISTCCNLIGEGVKKYKKTIAY